MAATRRKRKADNKQTRITAFVSKEKKATQAAGHSKTGAAAQAVGGAGGAPPAYATVTFTHAAKRARKSGDGSSKSVSTHPRGAGARLFGSAATIVKKPSWSPVGVSTEEFDSVVVPLLYSAIDTTPKKEYKIAASDVRALKEAIRKAEGPATVSGSNVGRNLTYGEVWPTSIARDVLPRMALGPRDVVIDIGSGTAKILLQAALQTPCARARGVELSEQRHSVAAAALERLRAVGTPAGPPVDGLSPVLVERLQDAGKRCHVEMGDCCETDMDDVTVAFINNVCFEPDLMQRITAKLAELPRLRRVVVLRKICHRHSDGLCRRKGSPCVRFGNPVDEGTVDVSWAEQTTVFVYDCKPLL